MTPRLTLPLFWLLCLSLPLHAEPVQLARDAALSPDGKTLAFAWHGDLWSVPVSGGRARQLTRHPAEDSAPAFSPDGRQIAFLSRRDGADQIFLMPASGGQPQQITFHSEGYDLHQWTPDGKQLLVSVNRDFSWLRSPRSARLALLNVQPRSAEQLLFDDYGYEPTLSSDGQKALFVREGEVWWRQGYQGSRAGQIWLFDRQQASFTSLLSEPTECRWPLWKPDGSGFYFVSSRDGTFNLWEQSLTAQAPQTPTQLTRFEGDSVVFPTLSRNGETLVFRHRFDFYRWHPQQAGDPEKIAIQAESDALPAAIERPVLTTANAVSFTQDGLQMAFLAGGDVWVMDTELREPRRVTHTAEEERGVTFAPDGRSLWFVSDAEGQTDLWKATPKQPSKPWWENSAFDLLRITQDPAVESRLKFSRDGKRLAYLKDRGDLWLADGSGQNPRRLLTSWNPLDFDFSPDGQWLVYAQDDESFNSDIWLLPVDGARPAFNLSRHPDNDDAPIWSPDGKKIAWTGRRENGEIDLFYAWLRAEDGEQTKRERTLAKAREKFKKPTPTQTAPPKPSQSPAAKPTTTPKPAPAQPPTAQTAAKPEAPKPKPAAKPAPSSLRIDWEGLHDRIHRISIPNTSESGLVWSPDSKKIAFQATIDGKRGTYTVEPPDDVKPKLFGSPTFTSPQWLKEGDQIVGLSDGKLSSLSAKGVVSTHSFRATHTSDRAAKQRAVFDQCWRTMRDHFYDERLGNRDWDKVREKYAGMAATAPDWTTVQDVIHLMLGELNGSHLGFALRSSTSSADPANSASPALSGSTWREETAHLGLRFDPTHPGPGWKVRDVIRKGPASQKISRIAGGEIILQINGLDLQPSQDPSQVLNGPLDRDLTLTVQASSGASREVILRPISYATARRLLYDQWTEQNRRRVETDSKGQLGYLHISAMDDVSFHRFQEQLYAAGAGKQGLIIDVRENGGGSTADHLLTALTQPRHAIAIPRGSTTPGYPQDRTVYATWHKPITVLCNQNSYSNAEIFSHAIKLLKRGSLIGVPTAGGVISTGSVSIMDVGSLRLPFRGWYGLQSGLDMELNGAQPDHLIWPHPGDLAQGIDQQLTKAIQVLQQEVATQAKQAPPQLKKASERFLKP